MTTIIDNITFIMVQRGTKVKRSTAAVKTVHFKNDRIPKNMISFSDIAEDVYATAKSWCKAHNYNVKKIESIIWN